MPRKPVRRVPNVVIVTLLKAPVAECFSGAMKAVNATTKRRGPAQGSLHYPWLFGAGALVDMMDRIYDVGGVRTRKPKEATK